VNIKASISVYSKEYDDIIKDVSKTLKPPAEIAMTICYPKDYHKLLKWINEKS